MTYGARLTVLALALVAVVTIVAYTPALRGEFLWDDDDHVTRNLAVQSPDGLPRIWLEIGTTPQYYPLVFTSFWVEYALWGAEPLGFHAVNVGLHILNAFVLWGVLRRLSIEPAWVAAAIFALHPVHVESVAWITERKNVLSGLFALSALLAYLRFAGVGEPVPGRRGQWIAYGVSMLLFTGAILSKTVTASLPAVILLLLWWKGRLGRRTVTGLLPMFLIGAIGGLTTVWLERAQIGATGAAWDLSPVDRCLIAGRALWFYLGKLAWPARLTFMYPRWEIDAGRWWLYLFPAAFALVLVALWVLRRRLGRGPLVAALVFSGTLVPALGFFDVYPMRFSFVADHFQYLASIAPISLVVGLLPLSGWPATNGRPRDAVRPWPVLAAVVFVLGGLAFLTWRQAHVYTDRETLWRDTIAKNPNATAAHENLGAELDRQGRLDEAIESWLAAARLGGDVHRAHHNLGVAFTRLGRPHDAVAQYRAAIASNPTAPAPYNNLAWLLSTHPDADVRDGAEAVRLAEQATRLSEARNPFVMGTLGAAYAETSRFEDAIRVSEHAITLVGETFPPELAERIRAQIRLYEQGRPLRETPQ